MCKTFNLEEAKAGKPVETLSGLKVRLFAFDIKDPDFPIAGAYIDEDGIEYLSGWTLDGSYYIHDSQSDMSLVMTTQRRSRQVWVNVYSHGQSIWDTREGADQYGDGRVACIPLTIEWEE